MDMPTQTALDGGNPCPALATGPHRSAEQPDHDRHRHRQCRRMVRLDDLRHVRPVLRQPTLQQPGPCLRHVVHVGDLRRRLPRPAVRRLLFGWIGRPGGTQVLHDACGRHVLVRAACSVGIAPTYAAVGAFASVMLLGRPADPGPGPRRRVALVPDLPLGNCATRAPRFLVEPRSTSRESWASWSERCRVWSWSWCSAKRTCSPGAGACPS